MFLTQTWTETAPVSLKSHKKTQGHQLKLLGVERVNLCVRWLYVKRVRCDDEEKKKRSDFIYTHTCIRWKIKAWWTNLALTSAKLLQPGSSSSCGRRCVSAGSCILHHHDALPALMHRQRPSADSGSLSDQTARATQQPLTTWINSDQKKKKKQTKTRSGTSWTRRCRSDSTTDSPGRSCPPTEPNQCHVVH